MKTSFVALRIVAGEALAPVVGAAQAEKSLEKWRQTVGKEIGKYVAAKQKTIATCFATAALLGAGAGSATAGDNPVQFSALLSGGTPGREVPLKVSLSTAVATVAGASLTLGVAAETPVAADPLGQPRCTSQAGDREAQFAFLPAGCTSALDCAAVEVRFPHSAMAPPLRAGVLFSCTLTLAADTPLGTYPSTIADAVAQGPDGNPLPNVVGVDGEVMVVDAYPALIEVGTARGAPGERVALEVRLRSDVDLFGVQADVAFPAHAPIAARNGQPDCTDNPDLVPRLFQGTHFAFRPSACTPEVDCTGVRTLILSLSNRVPLPDDAILYLCEMDIAADAPLGSYPLAVSEVDAAGGLVDGRDGTLIVELPTPTPTETPLASSTPTETTIASPTPTPPPTSTPTAPPTSTPTAPGTSTPTARGDDDDGCQVTAGRGGSAWALLLVPLMLAGRAVTRPAVTFILSHLTTRWRIHAK
jgi:hypothetical protein